MATQLEVVVSAQQGLLKFNKTSLMEAIKAEMVNYEIEVTEENQKEAKEARARLNKVSKALDDKRKEIKKQYCEPLVQFENDVKEIKFIVDEGSKKIGSQLDAFEQKRMQEKADEIKSYYESTNFGLVELHRLFDRKWLNKTCTNWQEELDGRIQKVKDDLDLINIIEGTEEERLEIKALYLNCLDITTARNTFDMQKAKREQIIKIVKNNAVEEQTLKGERIIEPYTKQRITFVIEGPRPMFDEINNLIVKHNAKVVVLEREVIE